MVTEAAARAVALNLIRPYVERGDSIQQIAGSGMSVYSHELAVAVGGSWCFIHGQGHHRANSVLVTRANGEHCCFQFRLTDLVAEIRSGATQAALF